MLERVRNIFKSDFGKIFSGNIVVQLTTVLQAVLVSRILGPEGKGLFIEIILWPTIIAGFSILGLYTGIAKLSAVNAIFDRWNIAKTALKAAIIVGGVGTLISCIVSPILVSQVHPGPTHIVIVFSLFVLINNVARCFNAIDHGRKDFTRYSITRSILNPIFFVGLLFLYVTGSLDLENVVLSFLFANFIVCLVRVILTLNSQRVKKKAYPIFRLFKYSLKFSVSDLSEPIYAYFDKAIIALVLLSYDLGIYTTAYSAASIINILSNVYGTKIFSDMASGSALSTINMALRHNFVLMGISGVCLGIAMPFLIPFVFGQDFAPAIIPGILLLITCIIQGQSYVIERSVLAIGFPYAGAKAKAVTMILLAVLAFSFKLCGFINIYVMVGIISICQMSYLLYMLVQVRLLCNLKLELLPTKNDIRYLIHRLMKS